MSKEQSTHDLRKYDIAMVMRDVENPAIIASATLQSSWRVEELLEKLITEIRDVYNILDSIDDRVR